MLRKLLGLTVAVGMLSLLAGSAQAGIFLPHSSTLEVQLGALPTLTTTGKYQFGGWATLTNNGLGHDLSDTVSIWKDTVIAGTSLLTGVALISGLQMTITNNSAAFTASFSQANPVGGGLISPSSTPYSGTLCPGGCLGGGENFGGRFLLNILGGTGQINLIGPSGSIGVGGFVSLPIGAGAILVTAAPFITGKARITNITTNIISIPGRAATGVIGVGVTLKPAATEVVRTFTTGGNFITSFPSAILLTQGTVTLGGTNALGSATAAGQVTLISPLRIDTAALGVGVIPGFVLKTFVFVPEPGTVLLLVSGAAGLIFIGRKRMKG
jgi:hypothetical protein